MATRRGGLLAGTLGDRMIVLFSYPHASDTDARQASMTALELTALGHSRAEAILRQAHGAHLGIRMGMHTGMAVVAAGEIPSGHAVSVAMRLEGVADMGTLLASESSYRLLRNQPARAWWQARHGGEAIGVPVRADRELVQARLKDLLPLAQGTVAQRSQQLWTLVPLQPHVVVARPQCPHCGDAGLMARRQREPVTLAPCLSSARPDGGWRTMPASATVARLAPHVNPLCGVIARVVPLGDEVEDALTVYRSEIFRTPAAHGMPSANALLQVCLGKGMSTEQSRASAMCEAIERYAAFHQGDEASVFAAASALDARCIPAHELGRFSDRQREEGNRPPRRTTPPGGHRPGR